ncbi:MAG TPA: hypothetical protein VKD72_10455 [Gemmataceae bacterium]|nr:hypothetical protein [Gemmataceae bacterium]
MTALTSASLLSNQQTTLELTCPNGKRVLGGGYDSTPISAALHTIASFPATAFSWRVIVRNSQPDAVTFSWRVYAVCGTVLN